MCLKLLYRFPA